MRLALLPVVKAALARVRACMPGLRAEKPIHLDATYTGVRLTSGSSFSWDFSRNAGSQATYTITQTV